MVWKIHEINNVRPRLKLLSVDMLLASFIIKKKIMQVNSVYRQRNNKVKILDQVTSWLDSHMLNFKNMDENIATYSTKIDKKGLKSNTKLYQK